MGKLNTKLSVFFSNKWLQDKNKWLQDKNKWLQDKNKWLQDKNKWLQDKNKWLQDKNKWLQDNIGKCIVFVTKTMHGKKLILLYSNLIIFLSL